MKIFVWLLLSFPVFAQSINWKPFFTFHIAEGLNFRVDTNALFQNAGVPGINIANDGKVLLGWSGSGPGGRKLGSTNDTGKSFIQLSGYQTPMQIDGGFIYLRDGKTRFVTEEPAPGSTAQRHKSRIVSWISSDGYNWTREAGIRYQPNAADDSISSVCEVIQIRDSLWRMYFVGDWYRSNGIRTAVSFDWGWSWRAESMNNILRKGDVDPHPVYLSNGGYRLYFRSGMNKPPSFSGVSCCDSPDGLGFDTARVVFLFSDSVLPAMLKLDPMVIKYQNGRIACYLGAAPFFNQPGTPKLIAAWSEPAVSTEGIAFPATGFSLGPNYPNPFNPATSIPFSLPRREYILLHIYNSIGKRIITAFEGWCEAGAHSPVFRADGLPSGMYYYELVAGNTRLTGKMVLLR